MATDDPDLRGVGGWLAFFLVTLGVFSPLFLAVTGYQALSDPQLSTAYGDAWPTLRNAEIALMGVIVAISWFACWRFLNVFNWTTVWIGVATIWTALLLNSLGEALIVSMITGIEFGTVLTAAMGESNAGEEIRPFVYATVWTLYLLRSQRVRNTYGPGQGEAVGEVFQ